MFQLFDPRCTLLMSEPRGEMILNGELLRMVGIEVAEDWNLVSTPQIVLESFSKLHGSEPMGWTESFSARAAAGDLEGTERILDYLYALSAWRAEDPEEVEAVAEDLRRSRAGHQRRLSQEVQTELDRLRRDVDTAAALALLQDRGMAATSAISSSLRQRSSGSLSSVFVGPVSVLLNSLADWTDFEHLFGQTQNEALLSCVRNSLIIQRSRESRRCLSAVTC